MINTYEDAYLAKYCTDDVEARAYDYVDSIATFTDTWRDKLAKYYTYILACLENQGSPDDLFGEKLKNYKKEFDGYLAQARAATEDDEGLTVPIFSIPLERA